MALRHLNDRIEAMEARVSGAGNGQSDVDARFAAAEQTRVALLKETHIAKVGKMVEEREAKKQEEARALGGDPEPADPGKPDDMSKFGKFDESVGAQSQATSAHPLGGNSRPIDKEDITATGDANRAWREQQYAGLAHVRAQIQEAVAARWK